MAAFVVGARRVKLAFLELLKQTGRGEEERGGCCCIHLYCCSRREGSKGVRESCSRAEQEEGEAIEVRAHLRAKGSLNSLTSSPSLALNTLLRAGYGRLQRVVVYALVDCSTRRCSCSSPGRACSLFSLDLDAFFFSLQLKGEPLCVQCRRIRLLTSPHTGNYSFLFPSRFRAPLSANPARAALIPLHDDCLYQ